MFVVQLTTRSRRRLLHNVQLYVSTENRAIFTERRTHSAANAVVNICCLFVCIITRPFYRNGWPVIKPFKRCWLLRSKGWNCTQRNGLNGRCTNQKNSCMYPSGKGPTYSGPIRYSRPIALTQERRSLVNDVCECVRDWRVRMGE